MTLNCKAIEPVYGCLTRADGTFETVVIHYEYRDAANGSPVVHAVRLTDAAGAIVAYDDAVDTLKAGACAFKQAYVVQRYILDANAIGEALPTVSATPTSAIVPGVDGKSMTVATGYRSLVVFMKSGSAGGSYFTMDGIRYDADMGGSRGDPIIAWSAVDEDSTFVDMPVIEVFDGAIVEVQVQREA